MEDKLDYKILTKTFENLPTGVGIFHVEDLDDLKSIRYVFMNKVILYEMRKTKEEVFGKKIVEVAPEAYEHEGGLLVIETYRRIAKEGGSVNLGLVEYSNHMVAGTYECSVHHIQDNYVYVMLRNVTKLEKTKLALEQKNKELSQLTSIASHDLKDPLNTITSFAQILNEDHFDSLNEEGQEIVSYISESTKRMRSLITDLLDYGRLGQNKKMVKVDCNKLMEEIQLDLAVRIKENRAEIKYDNLPVVIGLETELRLLFQNLISNGIKFRKAEENPIVRISAVEKDGWTFTVEDNGVGIDVENQKNIFSLFKRVKHQKEIEGDGIGLAHCKKIVDLHLGKLWLESEPGKGSKFHFNIPFIDQ